MKKKLALIVNLFMCIALGCVSLSFAEPNNATIIDPPLEQNFAHVEALNATLLSTNTPVSSSLNVQSIEANNLVANSAALPTNPLHEATTVLYTSFVLLLAILLLSALREASAIKLAQAFLVALLSTYSYLVLNYEYLANPNGQMLTINTVLALLVALSLFTFTHIARQLIRIKLHSVFLDALFLIIAFIGVAMAILPIYPKFHYLFQYLEYWPLLLSLTFLPCLIIWVCTTRVLGLYIFVLVVPIFTCLFYIQNRELASELLRLSILFSLAISSFILLFMPSKNLVSKKNTDSESSKSKQKNEPADSLSIVDPKIINLSSKMAQNLPDLFKLESALRRPLDELLGRACLLDIAVDDQLNQLSLAERQKFLDCRKYADEMVASSREIAQIITELPRFIEEKEIFGPKTFFNLPNLLSSIHNSFISQAESRKISFSWYVSPTITSFYKGDSLGLKYILTKLTESAIRANRQGAVRLAVSRYADDNSYSDEHDLGILEFSISDSGSGLPPLERSSLSLAKAWEFAARHQGGVRIETKPNELDIKIHIRLEALDQYGSSIQVESLRSTNKLEIFDPQNVLIVSSSSSLRRLVSARLFKLGKKVREASNSTHASNLYKKYNFATVLIDADMPNEESIATIAEIRHFEGEQALVNIPLIAIAKDEQSGQELMQAGCTNYLLAYSLFDLDSLKIQKKRELKYSHELPSFKPHLDEFLPLDVDEEVVNLHIEPIISPELEPENFVDSENYQEEAIEKLTEFAEVENIIEEKIELNLEQDKVEEIIEEFEPKIIIVEESPKNTQILETIENIEIPEQANILEAENLILEENLQSETNKTSKHAVKVIPNAKPKVATHQGGLFARFFSTKETIKEDELLQVELASSEFVSEPQPVTKEQRSFKQVRIEAHEQAQDTLPNTNEQEFKQAEQAQKAVPTILASSLDFSSEGVGEAKNIGQLSKDRSLELHTTKPAQNQESLQLEMPHISLSENIKADKATAFEQTLLLDLLPTKPQAKADLSLDPSSDQPAQANDFSEQLLDIQISSRQTKKKKKKKKVAPALFADLDEPSNFDELIDLTDAHILSEEFLHNCKQSLNKIDEEWRAYQQFLSHNQLKLAESSAHKMLSEAKSLEARNLIELLEYLLDALQNSDLDSLKQISQDFSQTYTKILKEYQN